MLWNIIRDWFVLHVFGGTMSNTQQINTAFLGVLKNTQNSGFEKTSSFFVPIGGYSYSTGSEMLGISLGDWLSTTATIIVLCAMCFFLFLVVRWLFRLTSGLLSGRG